MSHTSDHLGDTLSSRCKSLERLETLAEFNRLKGNISNILQIKFEYWQQLHNLQFFTMVLSMDQIYKVVRPELFRKARELRSTLADLKSYLLDTTRQMYIGEVKNVAASLRNKLKRSLASSDECHLANSEHFGHPCITVPHHWMYIGFGSSMNYLSDCVAVGLQEDRKVVFSPKDFFLSQFAFKSPIGCTEPRDKLYWYWNKTMQHHVPESLVNPLKLFLPHPTIEAAWYLGNIADHIIQPRQHLLDKSNEKLSGWGLLGLEPYAGIHLRYGRDKLTETGIHPFQKYLIEVEEWYAEEEHRRGKELRRLLFIAGDCDPLLVKDIKDSFPNFEFFYDPETMKSAASRTLPDGELTKEILSHVKRPVYNFQDEYMVENMMMDLLALVRADLFVGTMSSCFGSLIYQLRLAKDPYVGFFDSVLIDKEFGIIQKVYPFSYILVDDHHPQISNKSNKVPLFHLNKGNTLKTFIVNVSILFFNKHKVVLS